jgi:hypothetical protein
MPGTSSSPRRAKPPYPIASSGPLRDAQSPRRPPLLLPRPCRRPSTWHPRCSRTRRLPHLCSTRQRNDKAGADRKYGCRVLQGRYEIAERFVGRHDIGVSWLGRRGTIGPVSRRSRSATPVFETRSPAGAVDRYGHCPDTDPFSTKAVSLLSDVGVAATPSGQVSGLSEPAGSLVVAGPPVWIHR